MIPIAYLNNTLYHTGMGLFDVQENTVTVGKFMAEFASETHQNLLHKVSKHYINYMQNRT